MKRRVWTHNIPFAFFLFLSDSDSLSLSLSLFLCLHKTEKTRTSTLKTYIHQTREPSPSDISFTEQFPLPKRKQEPSFIIFKVAIFCLRVPPFFHVFWRVLGWLLCHSRLWWSALPSCGDGRRSVVEDWRRKSHFEMAWGERRRQGPKWALCLKGEKRSVLRERQSGWFEWGDMRIRVLRPK